MWNQFILINFHFVLNIIAALIFFMVTWLYFDAWFEHRALKNTFKIVGFLLLSFSFLVQGASIESSVLASPILSDEIIQFIGFFLRAFGYIGIAVGFMLDPLPTVPKTKGLVMESTRGIGIVPGMGFASVTLIVIVLPLFAGLVGFLHLRRATIGLENHLKPIGWGMYIIALYELALFALRAEGLRSVFLHDLLRPFGPVWILAQILLFIGVLLIGSWVFRYLLKRLLSQIFIIYSCSILVVFIVITVTFTFLLLRSIEKEALGQLETNVKVLNFALESKKAETLSDSVALSQSPLLASLLSTNKQKDIESAASTYLLSKNLSSVAVLNSESVIVAKGEDKEHNGISLSSDPLVLKALEGEEVSSVISKEGIFAPEISIGSASPVTSDDEIIGTVLVERKIDNAFVDGIKEATGLEVSVYGGDKLSATTLTALDAQARANGVIEDRKEIKDNVLKKGTFYQTSTVILNVPYLASYMPVKNMDGKILGMLFVGRPEITIIQSASRSMQATFLVANMLLIISIIPSYAISRYIVRQIQ